MEELKECLCIADNHISQYPKFNWLDYPTMVTSTPSKISSEKLQKAIDSLHQLMVKNNVKFVLQGDIIQ